MTDRQLLDTAIKSLYRLVQKFHNANINIDHAKFLARDIQQTIGQLYRVKHIDGIEYVINCLMAAQLATRSPSTSHRVLTRMLPDAYRSAIALRPTTHRASI